MIGAHAARGNEVRPGHIRQKNLGSEEESFQAVVSNMNKLYEEAAEAIAGEEALRKEAPLPDTGQPPVEDPDADMGGEEGPEGESPLGGGDELELLADIRDLLKELLAIDGGAAEGAAAGAEGFELPDNATEIDLTTGEADGEPDKTDELPQPGGDRIDIEAEDDEGVEGDDDDEDRIS
jgi:hypothetical protein